MKPNIPLLLAILTALPSIILTSTPKLAFHRASSLSNNSISLINPPSDYNVDIQNSAGFYVNVDLQVKHKSTGFAKGTVPMILGLYTSTSLFTSNCENFVDFNCSLYTCTAYSNSTTTTSYPYFQAQGYYLRTNAFLNNLYWTLTNNATYGNICTDGGAQAFGKGAYGILGMGFSENSSVNYIGSEYLFSIYFEEDGNGGQLLFTKDLTYSSSKVPTNSLAANNDWHVSGVTYVKMKDNYIPLNGSIIFDINADSLGFPLDAYQAILASFTTFDVQCSTSNYQPVCNYTGDINNLPEISISVGSQAITISPQLYIMGGKAESGTITLDIKALSSSLSAAVNYVTPEFSSYIIIGYNLLRNYYVVFDGSSYAQNSNVIEVYPLKNPAAGDSTVLYIVGGCIGAAIVLTIVILIYFKYVKKRKNQIRTASKEKVNLKTAGSVPLLEERQVSNAPTRPHFNSSLFPEEVFNEQSEYDESNRSSVQEQENKSYTSKPKLTAKSEAKINRMFESDRLRSHRYNTAATSETKASQQIGGGGRISIGTDDSRSRVSLSKRGFNLSSDSIDT